MLSLVRADLFKTRKRAMGWVMLIILGAVVVGSEYGYDTWKNLLTRRAGRVPFIISKWLVLIVAIAIGLVVLVPLGLALGLVLDATLHLTGPAVPLSKSPRGNSSDASYVERC